MEDMIIKTVEDLENFEEEFIEQGRRGIIKLTVPVLNINEWFAAKPSYYALLLGMTDTQLENIVYYADSVVAESKLDAFQAGQILDAKEFAEYEKLSEEDKAKVRILQGAEAVDFLISSIDLKAKRAEARETEISCMQELERLWARYDEMGGDDILHNLDNRILSAEPDENGEVNLEMTDEEAAVDEVKAAIQAARTKLEEARCILTAVARIRTKGLQNLIVKEITLFPVDMKGIMRHAHREMPYATYDIKHQYMRTINRNERVGKLISIGAPEIILRNEKRMLQEYVDCLIHNGARGLPYMVERNDERCPAASLTDLLLRNTKLV